jgi:DNA-binding IclR family transcriptional regulator
MASALVKGFEALRTLRRTKEPLTLTAIAESAGMATSTAHSLLADLTRLEAVVQVDDKRYQLGPFLHYLGSAYARNAPIYRTAWAQVVELCNELGLVGSIAVPSDNHHLVLASHQAGKPGVGVAFGGRVPIGVGSWGKAYFAWSGEAHPAGMEGLEHARELGYTSDVEEFTKGVSAVASAVTSSRGYEGLASCIASVSTMNELGFEEVGSRLAAITARASFTLGDASRMRLVGAE